MEGRHKAGSSNGHGVEGVDGEVMKMTPSDKMVVVPCMWLNREIGEMCPV